MIPQRVMLKGFLCYKEEQEVTFDGASVWVLAGLNEAVTPLGNPDAVSATAPENPLDGVSVMVVLTLAPPAARSAVRWPCARTRSTADSIAAASDCRFSECRSSMAAARIVARGFAIPLPAMSGAEP